MAIKHRKLFPTTNQTQDCQDICDPSCPYACFPDPDFYFSPPPPVTATPSTSHSGVQLSPYVIALITFTAAFILVVSYYVVVKVCWRRRRQTPPLAGGEDFLDENRGPMIDNPIWYINTVGLQPSVINSITAVKYLKGGGLIEGTDCSVCLNEFQENETLRLLPKCSHAFHIVCIDTWLRSHTNCPMCRCGVLSNTLNEPPPPPPVSNSIDSGSNQETLMEIQEFQEHSDELIANPSLRRDEFGEADDEMQIQRIKRSLSINLPINVHHSPVNSRLYRMMSASSISRSLHKRPVPMKRSFSYNGRSFLSRYYRNHKAVIWLSNFC